MADFLFIDEYRLIFTRDVVFCLISYKKPQRYDLSIVRTIRMNTFSLFYLYVLIKKK